MITTFNVRFWALQKKNGRRRPHGVRWITDTKEHSEWFAVKAQAEQRRSDLMQAARRGEAFEVDSGLPESELKAKDSRSLLQLAQAFIDSEWDGRSPNTRRGHVDSLAVAVSAFTPHNKKRPTERTLRTALTAHVLPTNRRVEQPDSEEVSQAIQWIERNSRPVQELVNKREGKALIRALGKT